MTKEDLTEDQLYELIKLCCELEMEGERYKIEGSCEDFVQLRAISDEEEQTSSYAELLEEIKESTQPVTFYRMSRFQYIV